MEQMKTLEQQDGARKAAARPFSEVWEEAWRHFEERVRQQPGLHVLIAIALIFILRAIPLRRILVLAAKLCLRLALPILFLYCASQVTEASPDNQASI